MEHRNRDTTASQEYAIESGYGGIHLSIFVFIESIHLPSAQNLAFCGSIHFGETVASSTMY